MKKMEDEHIERFVNKVMGDVPLEIPSPDFTSKVMAQAVAANVRPAMIYKPLISKSAWVVIFSILVVVTGYLVTVGESPEENVYWPRISAFLPHFKFSEVTLYAVAALAVMVWVEILVIKNYFNKKLTL